MTQIYSIQTVEEALACVQAGADAIGVAVATGKNLPAEVSIAACAEIFAAIGDQAKKVLIVVTDEEDTIYEPLCALKPDVIHICGYDFEATPDFVKKVKTLCPATEVLQAVAVDGAAAIDRARYFGDFCDMLILDSADPAIAGIGAAGITHDWSIDSAIVNSVGCRVILAGGLGPDNVAQAIRTVRPWGVDSFTKTSDKLPDGSSRKNPDKVRRFIENANAAFRETAQ